MMFNIPVYLPHHTIPWQLHDEVHKCSDAWLCQGIIRPSQNPYASQVAIVCRKVRETHLCIRVSLVGLYEFTHMPFRVSNVWSGFSHLMEQCLGVSNLSSFSIPRWNLDIYPKQWCYVGLVFNRLKEFHLKIKLKKCNCLTQDCQFLTMQKQIPS